MLVYDDHRTLLNVLFEIQKNKCIPETPNLIYFDQHDDAVVPRNLSIAQRLEIFGNRKMEEICSKEFWAYTEFDLCTNDDDWLTAAFDFNLIKDAICIGVTQDNNVQSTNERYHDAEIKHRLLAMSHLDFEIGNRGQLGDLMKQDDNSKYLRTIFSENPKYRCNTPYILDFDLDCFATNCVGEYTMAWPESIFHSCYVDNIKVNYIMNRLIANASLITICREPTFCGGLGESNKILSYLDRYFFNSTLRTMPIE